jgi:hypothetical protein
MIRKTPSGWHVDIQPAGRGGKRYRKSVPGKAVSFPGWSPLLLADA